MRRIAWKALSSCSVDSAAMWPDSEASSSLSGWMRSPAFLEDRGDRMLGEPIDLEVGLERPQLGGDRDVALGVAEPDRGGDVQGPPAP